LSNVVLSDAESELDEESEKLLQTIVKKKKLIELHAKEVRTINQPQRSRAKQPAKSIDEFESHLAGMGITDSKVRERSRGRKRARVTNAGTIAVLYGYSDCIQIIMYQKRMVRGS
jgi:hypothetical protein